jgi:Xaa-Pro aminopeptidase
MFLTIQKSCVAKVKPGETMASLHKHCIEGLTESMIELGLLKGSKESLIESKRYMKYFPHGTGHYLGMDVHDAGLYQINGEPRKLEPRMCFTVEPGLYITADDTDAPAELRGIGVRIEDDIVVTAGGSENLTTKAPKEIAEIEALMTH